MNTDNLIEFRKDLGLTQEEMGKIVGVKKTTYSNYENCNTIIPIDRLNIISNKYDLSLDYLLGISRTNDSDFKHIKLDNMKISKKLKQVRSNLNMSQEEFAKELKTSRSIISYYETGKVKITALVLIDYAKLCNKSIDWLCCKK